MEEKKTLEQAKKVRFDLNEEVFIIPSKWDRLSKCKNYNARIEDSSTKPKSPAVDERPRSQLKLEQRKIANSRTDTSGKSYFTSTKANKTIALNSRPNTSPKKYAKSSQTAARKSLRDKTEGAYENITHNRKLTSPLDELKIYHRPQREIPKLEIALPKISYTSNVKKSIEKALQRSGSKSALGIPLSSTKLNVTNLAAQGKKDSTNFADSSRFEKNDRMSQRRLSDSSISEFGGQKFGMCKPTNGDDSSRFSELSAMDIVGCRPFSAWSTKITMQTERTNPMKRGSSMSSLIPNSILY
ncbi:uncharacterized protein [Acropora muricata]|uniref:uncharacterized protein n=1 Tax=Acropora muricata TaxID=159855 RepID=UPI0034E61567